MNRSHSGLVVMLGLTALAMARADESTQAPRPKPEREQGVRLRLFHVEAPLQRMQQLAGDQSSNLDRTIHHFALDGGESYLTDQPGRYIAVLTASLHIRQEGEYRFLLASEGLATLRVGGNNVLTAIRSKHGLTGVTKLDKGPNEIEIVVLVSDAPPHLKLQWAPADEPDFTSLPADLLTAEAFFFRPTSPGLKRLVTSDDRPGRRQKVAGVYPSLDLETIHPPEVEVPVGGLATLADGTLVVATFDARRLKVPHPQEEPDGQLWLYHGAAGDPGQITRERIATNLFEPAGVCVVDDAIYVSQRLEVTRFDKQSDSRSWRPTTVASGWECNDFHALSFGLLHEVGAGDHPGYLYLAKGTGLGLNHNPPNHGSVWRIDLSLPPGENVEAITGGHRTPNGLGWGPAGTIFVTDNQGEYTPANELNLVHDGAFYGFFHKLGEGAFPSPFQPAQTPSDHGKGVTEAAVWLPQDEIGNSPSQPLRVPERWPFAGQMLVGDVRYGGLNRVYLQRVAGVWQGAAFRFTQGCEGGINRMAFGPLGALYVGAIGGDHATSWNWVDPQGHKTYQGLQRMKPNWKVTFDIEFVKAKPGGFEVRFTKPVDRDWLRDPNHYEVSQWTYEATPKYGGPKVDEESLKVGKALPSSDGLSVILEISGLKSDRVVHFVIDPVSLDGEEIWSAESWYTLRQMPVEAR